MEEDEKGRRTEKKEKSKHINHAKTFGVAPRVIVLLKG